MSLRHRVSRFASAILICLSPLLLAAHAAAQGTRSDTQQSRADAAVSATSGSLVSRYAFGGASLLSKYYYGDTAEEPDQLFTFNFLMPVFYNSNAEMAHVNGTQTLETNPEGRLTFAKQVGNLPWKFSGIFDANSDRFARANGADSDVIYARLRLQYNTGSHDQELQPFVEYRPERDYAPFFGRNTLVQQDFIAGFDKVFNFDVNFERVPDVPDSTRATVWSLGLTATIARRETDVVPSSYALTASPSITYNVTNLPGASGAAAQWSIALGADIRRRWYDQQNGLARRDWLVNPTLTVVFIPPLNWFKGEDSRQQRKMATALGRPQVVFQIAYAQLDSNKPSVPFRQWQIGPSLKTEWKF
jgi:hypothetical protein